MAKLRLLSVMILFAAAAGFGADPKCSSNPLVPSIWAACSFGPGPAKPPDGTQPQTSEAATGDARSRFWKVFPNGPSDPGFQNAQADFLNVLEVKDRLYLIFALQHEVFGDATKVVNAIQMGLDPFGLDPATPRTFGEFPKFLDRGIRPFAFPLFVQ